MTEGTATLLAHAQLVTADTEGRAAYWVDTEAELCQSASLVSRAVLHASAHGVFEPWVNGRPATESVLNPGWTSYEWRLNVPAFDVTRLVREGSARVTLSLLVGNGWWRGSLGFAGADANYGGETGVIAELTVFFEDGSRQTIATGPSSTARCSDVVADSLYNGQRIDARMRSGPPRSLATRILSLDRATLVPQRGPLMARQEVVRPVAVTTSPTGARLVDFGQNLVGWVRFTVLGPAGSEIVIRHAEVLDDGELCVAPLRSAAATDTFVLSGGVDSFEPTFTFHGFRYAEVRGWPGTLDEDSLEAVVVHSDLERTGWFRCSDPDVQRLADNAAWSQRGNFLSVPTDCPQRDERLGWTGDIAQFAEAACCQFDSAAFLDSWLEDVAAEASHAPGGVVPVVVPDIMRHGNFEEHLEVFGSGPKAIWSDAAVWVPWALWVAYGDRERLARHYPLMVGHLRSVERALSPSGLWDTGFQFGDWLDPEAPPDQAAQAKADARVVAQAAAYRSADLTSRAASVLGLSDESAGWRRLAVRLREAFRRHYVDRGIITSDCTTVYALALHFGLLDEPERGVAAARLAALVRAASYRITTGFAGTPYVTWALAENGFVADAFALLLTRECPSWLYPVTRGATTIWERWDSLLPDGRVNTPEMTSFNHYALGAVVHWLYAGVAGIRPAEPGYRSILIAPTPGPGLDHVEAVFDSVNGRIEVRWTVADGEFVLDADNPPGVSAEALLPNGDRCTLPGGRVTLRCEAPVWHVS